MATIHPTAIVDPQAKLDGDVTVGPYAIIGPHVTIGAGSEVQAHAFISGHTAIGQRCQIFPFACVGMKTQDLKFKEGDITFAEIGDDTVLREFSTVHLGTKPGEVTRVGQRCLVMAYCHIAHGCNVGNDVIMSNLATLAGEVTVEDHAVLGGMAGVHQFCRVGTFAMIGGATKIRQDCPPYMVVDMTDEGPRVVGPNVVGLQRSGFAAEVRSALKEAFKLIYREGLNRTQALERIKYEVVDLPEVRRLVEFYQKSQRGVH